MDPSTEFHSDTFRMDETIIESVCNQSRSSVIHLLLLCHYFDTTDGFFQHGYLIYFIYYIYSEKCQISDEMSSHSSTDANFQSG